MSRKSEIIIRGNFMKIIIWMENNFLDFPEVEMNTFSLVVLLWTN